MPDHATIAISLEQQHLRAFRGRVDRHGTAIAFLASVTTTDQQTDTQGEGPLSMLLLSPKIGERSVLPDDGKSSKAIRVLIADHDEALLACYRESLEAEGFRVRTATNAVAFLTKLRRWLPDAVVLEPYLPGGASRRAVRALRRCAHVPPTPVLIHGSQANAPARLEFPVCGYEVRPLRPGQLAERLREVLRRFKSLSARKGRQTSDLPAKACR